MNSPYTTWQQFQRPPAAVPQLPVQAAAAPTAPARPAVSTRPSLIAGDPFAPQTQTGGSTGGWSGGGRDFGSMFGQLFSGFGGQQNAFGGGFGGWNPFARRQAPVAPANGQTPMPNTAPGAPWYAGGMGPMAPRWGQQGQQPVAPQPVAPQIAPEAPLDAGVNQYQPYAQSHMAPSLGVARPFARGGLACKCGGPV